MKNLDATMEDILRHYEKNPKGWKVMSSRDRAGHRDVIVIHESKVWLIKEHEINPYKSVGLAAEVKKAEEEKVPLPDFGLRPIPSDILTRLAGIRENPRTGLSAIKEVLKQEPISSSRAAGTAVLQGPIFYSPEPLDLISGRNRELNAQLKSELEKMLLKKYPQTIIPYL